MNYKIINEENLTDDVMDDVVIRVKAFIMNSDREILVASSNGGVQLIGGHVEKNEPTIEALKREIKEEAGITISNEEISEPFYEVRHYTKNYFNTSKNVIAKIIFFVVKTDKVPDLNNVKRTKQEEGYHFNIQKVPYASFEEYVSRFLNNEKEVNRWIAKETLSAFGELKNNL